MYLAFVFEKKHYFMIVSYDIYQIAVVDSIWFFWFLSFTIYQLDADNFVSYCVDFDCPQIYKIAVSLGKKTVSFGSSTKGRKKAPSYGLWKESALYCRYPRDSPTLPNLVWGEYIPLWYAITHSSVYLYLFQLKFSQKSSFLK